VYDLLIKNGILYDGTGAPPRVADIAIQDGQIAEIGRLGAVGCHVIDADGHIVTPGFVDIHTHYDGQAIWDPVLDPSFSCGITTAILGNCGVGFAPVQPGQQERLVELMEGVEEIPGTALHAGLDFAWSSFDEFLDLLDSKPHSFDLGALLPHGPLRLYVMGDKVGTDKCASGAELAEMAALVDGAMAAGAFGLSSSRTPIHRTIKGDMTPDFDVDERELTALAKAVARHGGYLQFAPNGVIGEDFDGAKNEIAMYGRIIGNSGVNLHMSILQTNKYPDFVFDQLDWAEQINAQGGSRVYGQTGGRGLGTLMSFHGTNPFMDRPTFKEITQLPVAARLAAFSAPEIKARILTEPNIPGGFPGFVVQNLNHCYDLGVEMDYEPDEDRRITLLAARRNLSVQELLYDLMVETSDEPRLLLPFANYANGDFSDLYKIMQHPAAVLGLSDAGAHVMTVCDGAVYPFMLTHWVRDRMRGPRLTLEQLVSMMTRDTARSVGLHDRGIVASGYKADINIIDYDRLCCTKPRIFHDLPDGSPRLMQKAKGFRATIMSGTLTLEHDEHTGALPGRLLRHSRRH
jgi:N-acyl-D-aspartate/D-glutamate deacylase